MEMVGQVGEGRAESSYLLMTIQPLPFNDEILSPRRWSWGRECAESLCESFIFI